MVEKTSMYNNCNALFPSSTVLKKLEHTWTKGNIYLESLELSPSPPPWINNCKTKPSLSLFVNIARVNRYCRKPFRMEINKGERFKGASRFIAKFGPKSDLGLAGVNEWLFNQQ